MPGRRLWQLELRQLELSASPQAQSAPPSAVLRFIRSKIIFPPLLLVKKERPAGMGAAGLVLVIEPRPFSLITNASEALTQIF